MIYLHWVILTIYALIVVYTMIRVLMDNRQPVKTMAWLLILTFMPIVGIIFYFFFGQNTRKERYISQRSMDLLTKRSMFEYVEQSDLRLPYTHKALMNLFTNQSMALPFKDNDVEIFTDGYVFFQTLLATISHAHHHIHLILIS